MTDWSLCCKAIIKPDSFDWPRCAACGRIVREMIRDGIRIREGGVPVSALVCPDEHAPASSPRTWDAWRKAHIDQERAANRAGNGQAIEIEQAIKRRL